ncbi:MFS transporter permease [Serratia fonticola]
MIWFGLYLMISAYLLGRHESGKGKADKIDLLIILFWLPVAIAFLSSLLAKKVLGD